MTSASSWTVRPGPAASITTRSGSTPTKTIAADTLMERDIPIEYGPSIHGIGEQTFLYYREPSSMRIEPEHRRLPQLRAGLDAQHLEALARIEQHVPQRRHADVDDGIVPVRRRPERDRGGRARRDP